MADETKQDPQVAAAENVGRIRLYEAVQELNALDDLIEEHAERIAAAGGDIESVPEIAELLSFGEAQMALKVERIGLMVCEFERSAEAVDAESQRLARRSKTLKNRAAALTGYVHRMMVARGQTKSGGDLCPVRIQKNSVPSVRIQPDVSLEDLYADGSAFVERTEELKLDTRAVAQAWKNGDEVPDGVLVEFGTHLRIG